MNPIVEEMQELLHYGTPRHSGRYPWGSGEDPYQHGSRDFLGRIEELKRDGWTETPENIKKEFGLTTTEYRIEKALCTEERRKLDVARVKSLQADGLNKSEIGRRMGINESSVRSLLNETSEDRMNKAKETAEFLKKRSEECKADGGMIEVGAGAELELNISREKLNQALYILKREGYGVYSGRMPQVTNPGQYTTQMVLCPPDIKPAPGKKAPKEIYEFDRIHSLKEYISRDGGETYEKKFTYPESMDSKRLKIRYNEEGGLEKDGIIELRRGVADLSLGESRYSQVRILVDGTHYLKGMAVYSDDMPDGVDVIFNTNKKQGTEMSKVLKEIKKDPDNPFGSAIKDSEQGGQYWYDPKTGERVSSKHPGAKLGLINKRADEGDWSDWKDALPSQFLSKQPQAMAKKQLDLAKADKLAEYDDILNCQNPTIKKYLLQKFSDECDSAAVHLQAAALPGQKYHVIVPINSLKENEIYAPNYENGTQLALIRYPHGGPFEIPILTVNNKHPQAKKLLGSDVTDAVGITSKVAEQLSGADFDGDTVMCIPTNDKAGKVRIKSVPYYDALKGFDPKTAYGYDEKKVDPDGTEHYFRNGQEFRVMKNTGTQMGVITNLISDMTLLGASEDKIARAVKHSMVVIDAEKHKLDYKQSEIDNNIASLHKEYQGRSTGGAATIISKAKGQKHVPKRQGTAKINIKGKPWYDPTKPEGSYIYQTAKDANYEVTKVNKRTGEVTTVTKTRMEKTTKMADATDAYELISPARHPMEIIYADYANSMKDLANRARVEMVGTGKIAYSPSAKNIYSAEVKSLNEKLRNAELNRTREREAQRMANVEVRAKVASGQIDKKDTKKAGQQALTRYRTEVGATTRKDRNIIIEDKEWEAIQAGAIHENTLKRILNNTDIDVLRERATPRSTTTLSAAQINRIKKLSASDYTLAEIAQKMGKSPSTISKYLKGVN